MAWWRGAWLGRCPAGARVPGCLVPVMFPPKVGVRGRICGCVCVWLGLGSAGSRPVPGWFRVVPGGPGWLWVVPGGSGWFRVVLGGSGWFRVVPVKNIAALRTVDVKS